jgi:FkbM family methyltransferase
MLTNELKDILKPRAVNEMQHVRDILNEQNISIDVIADIGANIGYYSEALLETFLNADVHAYEPHPHNLKLLYNVTNDRLHVHPYGLFDKDTTMEIGMRDSRNNNGTFSIFNTHESTSVSFKNANTESVRPDFIKLDVEGSELFILQCDSFLENVKAIFIELIYTDEFSQNSKVTQRLNDMGFVFSKQITKNDQLWLKL